MEAFALPKGSDAEKTARKQAIQDATRYATEVPFRVMSLCCACLQVIKAMAETGNPTSASAAGVGALAVRAGVRGAFLNVKINAGSLEDTAWAEKLLREGEAIAAQAEQLEREILAEVERKISG
jgi:glutamate formiminotransferase/formiminotetrahydrofolate cyclodeaminase